MQQLVVGNFSQLECVDLCGRRQFSEAWISLRSVMAFQPSPDQWILSEQLQLLHELRYSEPDMLRPASRLHTDKTTRAADTNTNMRILDVIASALTTSDGDTLVGSGEGQVRLCDHYVDAVQRACGAEASPSSEALRKLTLDFPDLRTNWIDGSSKPASTPRFASFCTSASHCRRRRIHFFASPFMDQTSMPSGVASVSAALFG